MYMHLAFMWWNYFIELVWFFVPAALANMAAGASRHINFLAIPVDFGKKIGDRRIFGSHKTWRGFFFGIIFALVGAWLQRHFSAEMIEYSLVDYQFINIWLWGFLLGFGALFGDLMRSFFKRRINIAPGKTWFPFDQIDWVIGAVAFSYFYFPLDLDRVLIALSLAIVFHPLINYLCYLGGLQKNKF